MMNLLRMPKVPWEMRTKNSGKDKTGPDPESHEDVCINCRVEGQCNDHDIKCALVAIHNRKSDGTSAAQVRRQKQYLASLRSHLMDNGDTPFPEQRNLIISDRGN